MRLAPEDCRLPKDPSDTPPESARELQIGGYFDRAHPPPHHQPPTPPFPAHLQQLLKLAMDSLLSDMERKVLSQYLSGKSYKEISAKLGKEIKAIDNALQRVKKKLDKFFAKQDKI